MRGSAGEATDGLARRLLEALDGGRQLAPLGDTEPGFDVATAYRVQEALHRARRARGERPVGRKIGFTNRTLWREYGVHEPIWGFVYDGTLSLLDGTSGVQAIGHLLEPRIEPEIVVRLRTAPPAGAEETRILDAVDWIAHGFELVQSPYPGWRFQLADTVAANGLHGALVVGPRVPAAAIPDCARRLREFRIALEQDGTTRAVGKGADVLDSPLLALAHLVQVLRGLPAFPPLAAGEIVTTGTLTAALPVAPGQTWSTRLSGIALPDLTLAVSHVP